MFDDDFERECREYEVMLGGPDSEFVRAPEDSASSDRERLLRACDRPISVGTLATRTGLPRVRALRALCMLYKHGAIRMVDP